MLQVTKDQFYATVGPLNATSAITNDKWPYTSDFTIHRELVGRVIGRLEGPFEVKDYYLADARAK